MMKRRNSIRLTKNMKILRCKSFNLKVKENSFRYNYIRHSRRILRSRKKINLLMLNCTMTKRICNNLKISRLKIFRDN